MNPNIIIKKMNKYMGVKSDTITMGDAREQCASSLAKNLELVINEMYSKGKESYYILVYAGPHRTIPGAVTERIIILDQMPSKMLGTMLFYVNNKLGSLQQKWVLPLDIPTPGNVITERQESRVLLDAQGLPIVNSMNK